MTHDLRLDTSLLVLKYHHKVMYMSVPAVGRVTCADSLRPTSRASAKGETYDVLRREDLREFGSREGGRRVC